MLRTLDNFFLQQESKAAVAKVKANKTKSLGMLPSDLTQGSLFSGVGGFELGAERAGIPTLWSCEIEQDCRELLREHFPNTKIYSDIKTLKKPGYVDIISGGFPCQDISVANVSNEKVYTDEGQFKGIKGERSGLWKQMFRIIAEGRPKYAVLENSPLLTRRGLEVIIQDFSKIGYCLEWQILSAAMCGFQHYRKRFYGVAYPIQNGRAHSVEVFDCLQKLLPSQPPRQAAIPRSFKRYGAESDFRAVRIHNGFSERLDSREKRSIEMMGNAAMPDVAELVFNAIKMHHERINQ